MKKIFIFLLLLCCTHVFAWQTTLISSIHAGEVSNYSASPNSINIPTTTKRVHFINRVVSYPEMDVALTAAEYIFSDIMKSKNIDLVTIEAEVSMGEISDFDMDEVCKVVTNYTDEYVSNVYYPHFSTQNNGVHVLYPMSIYNQCNGISQGPCMQILLNPSIPFYFGTSTVPPDKFDGITIFLRALAIGCGIQSSLNHNTLEFGLIRDGNTYISAYDTHIFNDQNAKFSNVATGSINAATFLGNRTIFAEGYNEESEFGYCPVLLYNDWELGVNGYNVTHNTLNTISPFGYTEDELENGFIDILEPFLNYGIEQRTITPYTMTLLRGLGWRYDIPVGFEDNIANVYNSVLCCSSTILQPDHTYSVWLSPHAILSDITCMLQATDSMYTIANGNNFSFHSIPENVQWKRNPITKNIIGQIRGKARVVDGIIVEREKILNVEFPYKPNKPIIQKNESTNNGEINLNLKAFANGSDTYTITYTGVTYGDTHTFTTSADVLDTILTNISGNQLYNLSIYGTNNEGNSDSYNFTFGFSAHPPLNMTISVLGNVLKYDLSNNGTIDISEVVISSVQIVDRFGVVVATPTAGSGEPISISSLERGFYILRVVADGNLYSRLFIKR